MLFLPERERGMFMNTLVNRLWWILALRGVLAVLFGLVAFFMPGITLAALVLIFGAFAFIDGLFLLAAGIRAASHKQLRWRLLILQGIVGIIAGVVAWVMPGLTALSLLYLMAVWAMFTGVMEIVFAIRLRREIDNGWMLGLSGLLSVALGIAFILLPAAGLIAWVWMIGAYALISGILLIALGWRLRALAGDVVGASSVTQA